MTNLFLTHVGRVKARQIRSSSPKIRDNWMKILAKKNNITLTKVREMHRDFIRIEEAYTIIVGKSSKEW